MEIKAKMKNGKLYFKNFVVSKESDSFYAVYHGEHAEKHKPITSAPTLKQAAKKAKLLQIGYEFCKEDKEDEDDEWK